MTTEAAEDAFEQTTLTLSHLRNVTSDKEQARHRTTCRLRRVGAVDTAGNRTCPACVARLMFNNPI